MGSGRDAFLEVLRTETGLRFTFLDRARPSLSYEQVLEVPSAAIEGIAGRHRAVLEAVSDRISRNAASAWDRPAGAIDPKTEIHRLSEDIRTVLFPEDLLAHIRDFSPSSLLIRTNCPQVPWELSRINGDVLGLKLPTGRGLLTQRPLRRVATRKPSRCIRVLLIANPTEDLPGADAECSALTKLFEDSPFFEALMLQGSEATLANLTQTWVSGNFDVLHYAGHSTVGDNTHGDLLLADGRVGGQYLSKILERHPPKFVFLNSCSSGVVAGSATLFDDLIGLAPNLLRVGVDAVVGAAWPVIDDAAVEIAANFYGLIGQGIEVGAALNRARRSIETRDDIPYWLGYALFGDPDLRLLDDNAWKVDAIRSGGRVAAASTFSGRASLHVSSLHSFLMSAAMTDTSALAIACECRCSEALVYRRETDLPGIAAQREVRIGVPGATGSAIFARKIALEIGLAPARCRFIELDTAEVRLALDRGVIDATVLWYPDLAGIDTERFVVCFSEGQHDYTLCVLVGRTPRTEEEYRATREAVSAFVDLGARLRASPKRWAKLLAEQMGLPSDQIMDAMAAYDFQLAGLASRAALPTRVREFIQQEVNYMEAEGLIEAGFDLSEILLAPDNGSWDGSLVGEPLAADIQWSISSLPLLMGRFLGVYS